MTEDTLEKKSEPFATHYGHIDTQFFHYVTPGMIICVAALVGGIAASFTKVSGYFMHNPPLNGGLLVIEIVGLYKAFRANISILNVARFLKKVEIIQNQGAITPEDVVTLRQSLEKDAHLLSMAPVSMALNDLATYGHLNIRDDTARLIKSKFGMRVAHLRSNVNYFCGIMVMLGLIGTFWGLLRTISDVGIAMTKISQSVSGGAGANLDMGEFLQSISKPMEGMGIGFSASLFGLGGSLFLGFFNYIATYVHDNFIENFGRWLDDRIPRLNPAFTDKAKLSPLPGSDDLKAWLAGFVYLSKETHQRMSQLFSAFADANQINSQSLQRIEHFSLRQDDVLNAIESGNQKLTGIHNTLKSFAQDAAYQHTTLAKIHSALPELTAAVNGQTKLYRDLTDDQTARVETLLKQAQHLAAVLSNVGDGQSRLEQSQSQLASSLLKQSDAYQVTTANHLQQLASLTNQLQQWSNNFAQMGDVHSGLLSEIKTIKRIPTDTPHIADISSLIVQVNTLLGEIGEASDDGLLEAFRKAPTTNQDPSNKGS